MLEARPTLLPARPNARAVETTMPRRSPRPLPVLWVTLGLLLVLAGCQAPGAAAPAAKSTAAGGGSAAPAASPPSSAAAAPSAAPAVAAPSGPLEVVRMSDAKELATAPVYVALEDSPLPLVVRKELVDSGEVRGPVDLRGRKVAMNTRGASPEYILSKVMEG